MKTLCLLSFGFLLLGGSAAQAQFSGITNNGIAIITGYFGSGGAVTIPSTFDGLPVASIEFSVFYSNTTVTSVTIPFTLTNISQQNLFVYCSDLAAITVDSNNPVLSSDGGVLFDKYQTTLFAFPAGNGLTSYAVPNSVRNIGLDAFTGCYTLTNLTLPGNLTNIAPGAFSDSALTGISLPNSLTSISTLAFDECHSLTDVTLGNSVTSIGDSAFNGTGITGITIPDSVIFIGEDAFSGANLTNIILPNGVASIGNYAFLNCSQLPNVTIPASVTNLGYCPFGGCTNMTAIGVDSGNPVFISVGGIVMDSNQTEVIEYPAGKVGAYAISRNITSLGTFAFAYCPGLTGVFIPDSVTNIGIGGFTECSSLTNVTIPGSVVSLGDGAFSYCSDLSSVTISNGVALLGQGVFANTGLINVTIPDSVTNMGFWDFEYCSNLANVVIGSNITSIQPFSFEYSGVTNIALPNGLGSIGELAFYFCTNLAGITIPANVTNIGSEAFSHTGLTSITIPNSVTTIEASAFEFNNLTNVIIGRGVTDISDNAFILCENLEGVYFLGNAPSIGATVFQYAAQAKAYYLPGTSGWSAFSADTGLPVVLWNPLIQTFAATFGVQNGQFGFNITGGSNLPVVVEACTNLANPAWVSLATVTLANGSYYFSDPQWTNYPGRFYSLGLP